MFEYRGKSEGFRKTIETYGQQLAKIYKAILRADLPGVERLATHGLFYTPERGQITARSIKPRIEELFGMENIRFFVNAHEITQVNEAVTRGLDRRILALLGYHDTGGWVDYMSMADNEQGMEKFRRRDKNRQRNIARLPTADLVDFVKNWHTSVDPKSELLYTLLQSLQRYRVQKITTEEAGGVEKLLGVEHSFSSGEDYDNLSASAILFPPRDRIIVSDNGEIELKDTSRFVTAPFIILSDDGVDLIRDQLAPGVPPYLVALVHEFDHFVGYCLQKYPFAVASGLLHMKATEK